MLGNFTSQGFVLFFCLFFVQISRLRKSPQYLLVILQGKRQSPQISAILRKTFTNIKIQARKIPYPMPKEPTPCCPMPLLVRARYQSYATHSPQNFHQNCIDKYQNPGSQNSLSYAPYLCTSDEGHLQVPGGAPLRQGGGGPEHATDVRAKILPHGSLQHIAIADFYISRSKSTTGELAFVIIYVFRFFAIITHFNVEITIRNILRATILQH